MTRHELARAASALSLALVASACANPADNVPAAEVGEVRASRPAPAETATRFRIAPGSKVSFVGSKVTGSHDGGFREFAGELTVVDGAPEKSGVTVVIRTASLWADNDRLTGHLKSPDFFDVARYPTATFTSTSIERAGEGYSVTGNLDLHGLTRSITFPARIAMSPERIEVQAEFFINRFDFDIVYPGRPDDLIRKEVVIRLDVQAVPGEADLRAVGGTRL